MTKHLAFIALVAAATPACEQNRDISNPAASFERSLEAQHVLGAVEGWRAVYTLTNQVAGNAVAVFNRAADGTLSAAGTIATGGTGTGGSLGSQGAVALSDDGRRLFAVNAGSNDVSVFDVGPTGLSLASQTASGGTLPISLTAHGSLLYVLNAGGAGNISGFSVGAIGGLTPIAGSTQPLSGTNPTAAASSSPRRTPICSMCTPWTRTARQADARRWRRPAGRRSGSPSAIATTSSCRKPRARPRPMCWTPEISRS